MQKTDFHVFELLQKKFLSLNAKIIELLRTFCVLVHKQIMRMRGTDAQKHFSWEKVAKCNFKSF